MTTFLDALYFDHEIITENFHLLLENRIDFIKQKHSGKYDTLVDHLATVDPTPNKKYTEWLVDRHIKGDNVIDRAGQISDALKHFSKATSVAHDTNIKNHTIDSMLDVAHLAKTSPKQVKPGHLEKLYDSDGVTGFRIPDRQTSVDVYGNGRKFSTNWCTATPSSNNMFDSYPGGKYTMHFPNGHFLQFHHGSMQAKDPEDSEIDFNSDERYKHYANHVSAFMRQTHDKEYQEPDENDISLAEQHFGMSDDEFNAGWEEYKKSTIHTIPTNNIRKFIKNASRHKLTDEQIDFLQNRGWSSPVANNPHLTHEQVGKILSNKKYQARSLVDNPAVKGEHVDTLYNRLIDEGFHHMLGRIRNLQPHHISDILSKVNYQSNEGRNYASALDSVIDNTDNKFQPEHLNHILHSGWEDSGRLLTKIGEHQVLPEPHRSFVVQNHINWAMSGQIRPSVTRFARKNDVHSNEIHFMIDNVMHKSSKAQSGHELARILNFKDIKQEHIDRIVAHQLKPNSYESDTISYKLMENSKFPHSAIEEYINSNPNSSYSDSHLLSYMTRRDAKVDIVDKMNEKAQLDPNDLEHIGYYRMKGVKPTKDAGIYHYMRNLKYHLTDTASDLHRHIDMLHDFMEKSNVIPSSSTMTTILNHPNVDSSHIHKLLDHYGDDWMIRDAIEEHDRTPPSVHQRLKNIRNTNGNSNT